MFEFTAIDFPGPTATQVLGLNAAEVGIRRHSAIAGSYTGGTGSHGFLLAAGSFTTIDVPGASHTEVYGINNSGEILVTVAFGINHSGQIVGRYHTRYGYPYEFRKHGFSLPDRIYGLPLFDTIDVPQYPPSGPYSNAVLHTEVFGINDEQIVGSFNEFPVEPQPTVDKQHGFLLADGSYSLIEFSRALQTITWGIDNPDPITGGYAIVGSYVGTQGHTMASSDRNPRCHRMDVGTSIPARYRL